MSSATMHFGPEWMRTKSHQLSRSQTEPSPQVPSALATYSALVSAAPLVASEQLDESHPFRYSKQELLAIYQEGGGKGGLGLEVDRWEGVVREATLEPVTLREMTDVEKKLFAGSLNAEMRRRQSQSTDHFSPLHSSGLERSRMMPGGSVVGSSPLRERFGLMKRKDSTGGAADSSSTSMPRKPSLSTLQVSGVQSSTSPRTRVGHTSNFDGVLNNGDSWMARRLLSEASMKTSNLSSTELQADDTCKPRGIAEVKEDGAATAVQVHNEDDAFFSPVSTRMNSAISTSYNETTVTENTAENLFGTGPELGESPAVIDLAAVEWSYKDPTGQIQGPFRADLVQKWYEEGYFTPDLPMKRTRLDSQWSTVQELVTQAEGPGVFLRSPFPAGPPGREQQPPHNHNEPFQPAPIRSLNLESSLLGTSMVSESPSSSFGASQLGTTSLEPSMFIGRDRRPYNTFEADGRIPSLGRLEFSTSGFMATPLDSGLNAAFEGQPSGSLDIGLNGHAFNSHPSIFSNSSFGIANTTRTPSRGVPQHNLFNDEIARGYGFDLVGSNHLANIGPPSHEPTGIIPFSQSYPTQVTDLGHNQTGQTSGFRIQESIGPHILPIHNGLSGQSPWAVVPDPGAYPSMATTEGREPTTLHANDGMNGVALRNTASGETAASRLNVEVNIRHSTSRELAQLLDEQLGVCEQDTRNASPSDTTFRPSPASETGKSFSRESKPVSKSPLEKGTISDGLNQVPAKSAWSKDDDGKGKKGTTTSISLRAIQEAEAKKQQILKASEREKKETTRANVTPEFKEDLQPFMGSWGLPTSQTAARGNIIIPTKDVPAQSAMQATHAVPVWTTTSKTPVIKKAMKEIQEEEEKRKRLAAKDISVATSKRFAETTSKTTLSPVSATPSNNNPWTTVGPNGKPTFPSQPSRAPSHTTFSSAVSNPSGGSRSIAPLSQRNTTISSTKARPVAKPGEVAESPSLEFLKWLGDSLKGLNSSANVEEIMSMLLSFPLDPDSSTLEIISDTIYANSTTLDGRRFASDFVAKRKADVTVRSKALPDHGKTVAHKPVSIADVVKAVPKSTQSEWGFKVVNKKKKGGRS